MSLLQLLCGTVALGLVLGETTTAQMIPGQSIGIDFGEGGLTPGAGREKNFVLINGNKPVVAAADTTGKPINGVTIEASGIAAEMKDATLGFAKAGVGNYDGTPFSDLSFNDGVVSRPGERVSILVKGLNPSLGYDVQVLAVGPTQQNNPLRVTAGGMSTDTNYNAMRSGNVAKPVKLSGVASNKEGELQITIGSHGYCGSNAIHVNAVSERAEPLVEAQQRPPHYVPADKKLSKEWLAALEARGERKVYRGKELFTIGMPVSGIAAGQLYVRGDGTLARWWMFNEDNSTDFRMKDPNTGYRTFRPPSRFAQGMAVSAKAEGGEAVTLELSEEGFKSIGFIGEYPIGTVLFEGPTKDGFPLEIQGEYFSPTIPLNAKESATPGTILRYTLKNPTDRPVEVSLGGWVQHMAMPQADDSAHAKRRSRPAKSKGYAGVTMDIVPPVSDAGGEKEALRITLFDDFETPIVRPDGTSIEKGSLAKWTAEGDAFADKASKAKGKVRGYQGDFVACSVVWSPKNNKNYFGKLISEPFTIEEPFIGFMIAGGRYPTGSNDQMTGMKLIVDGKVVRSSSAQDWQTLQLASWNVSDLKGQKAHLEIVDGHVRNNVIIDDIHFSNQKPQAGKKVFPKLDPGFGEMSFVALDSDATVSTDWGSKESFLAGLERAPVAAPAVKTFPISAKLCSTVTSRLRLAPGESKTLSFAITWYFPNFAKSRKSTPTEVGRMYTNWYANSGEVADFLVSNYGRLYGETAEYRDALYLDTTLPNWFVQRSAMSSCNLASNTVEWWKNGRFYSMEGTGFCLGTCGHVWNYSQSPSRLFPELERSVRIRQDYSPDFGFNKDGRINFRGYRHDSDSFDVWGYIPDAQCGYVLKAYREHLMSADDKYLDELWPRIKKATEYLMERDGRAGPVNGVLEDLQHLTDSLAWGPNSYTGSLYLAALRASEEMATLNGDTAFAKTCHDLAIEGSKWTLEHLWNGEYFIHKYEPAPKGELPGDSKGRSYGNGCLADQVFGQNWAHQLGLGYVYPKSKVKASLESVFKYNWTPDVSTIYDVMTRRFILLADRGEPGMVGVTYPLGDPPSNRIGQNDDPWTGYEYQVASGMIWEDMLTEGLSIAYGVHQRYNGTSHNPWNEIEGGDHYSRSMSAWGMLLAASGFEYDGPAGKIGFAPHMQADDFQSYFTGAEGWGTLVQKREANTQHNSIKLRWGKLRVKTLVVEVPVGMIVKSGTVTIAGVPVKVKTSRDKSRITFTLPKEATVQAGQAIAIELAW